MQTDRTDTCAACSTPIDPDKGERFLGDNGEAYCADDYADRLMTSPLDYCSSGHPGRSYGLPCGPCIDERLAR